MALEIESKHRIPDLRTSERILADATIRAYLQEAFMDKEMASSYYDTPAHELNRLRWALRLRREGDKSVAALKRSRENSPNELTARDEWQYAAENIQSAIGPLVRMGAPAKLLDIAARGELEERCRIVFTRTSGVLELPEGAIVEMSVDNGNILAEDRQEPFIELELELLYGGCEELVAFAARLSEEYGLVVEHASKYERALRLLRSRGTR